MKKLILISLSFLLFSCGNKSGSGNVAGKSDTIKSVAVFQMQDGSLRMDYVFKIIKDTFAFSQVDKDTQKKIFKRDTTYYVPIVYNLKDTTDKTGKRELLDSNGKVKQSLVWLPAPTNFIIHDFNKKL